MIASDVKVDGAVYPWSVNRLRWMDDLLMEFSRIYQGWAHIQRFGAIASVLFK